MTTLTSRECQVPRSAGASVNRPVIKFIARKEFPRGNRVDQCQIRIQHTLPATFYFVCRGAGIRRKQCVPLLCHELAVAYVRRRWEEGKHMNSAPVSIHMPESASKAIIPMNVFQVGSKVSRVVHLILKQNARHLVRHKLRWVVDILLLQKEIVVQTPAKHTQH